MPRARAQRSATRRTARSALLTPPLPPHPRSHFEALGFPITDFVLITQRDTGASRGFGFVTFTNQADVDEVLAARHIVNGRMLDVKPAVERQGDGSRGAALDVRSVNADGSMGVGPQADPAAIRRTVVTGGVATTLGRVPRHEELPVGALPMPELPPMLFASQVHLSVIQESGAW